MIELAKLLISLVTLILTGSFSALQSRPSLVIVAPYAVPAVLYALNNNLVVHMQAYMDPSSYQVLSNLKIASTALLYSSCLGKKMTFRQWFALGLLMTAGVCHSYSSLDLEDTKGKSDANEHSKLRITAWGLFLVLVYCCVSGLAAVYTEMVLKRQKLPLSLQNLYLYVFGVALNLVLSFSTIANGRGFLEGYTFVVWVIIAGQAVNGLLMSVVLKHGSGITRLFVISCSIIYSIYKWLTKPLLSSLLSACSC
uniref:Solute carrier family 35 member A4 n=1 Tax=Neogobius melanostomus TaxID=47308 RepID=A0A8C6UA78_9GOBI